MPFGTAASVPLFDLQRVEVLRGPQGTLFGRNATGGLIQYISNAPAAGTSGALEGAYGSRELWRVQGFVNAGSDIVSGRLAFYYQSQNGNIVNTLGPDRGDKTVYALRGQLRVKPTENTTVTLRIDGFNQSGTPQGYLAPPAYYVNGVNTDLPANVDAYGTGPGKDPYGYRSPYQGLKVALNDPGEIRKRARNYSLTAAQNFGDTTLTSVTAYGTIDSRYRDDTDSSPLRTYGSGVFSDGNDFQQELRINGGTDRLRYTGGVFYLNINGSYSLYNDIVLPASLTPFLGLPAGELFESDAYRLKTRSEAIYGQAEYDISDRITAIIGARYTWDQFHFNFESACQQTVVGVCAFFGGDGGTGLSVVGIAPLALDDRNGDWSGKAQVNFKLTNRVLFYASASKGLKSAGFTAPLSNTLPAESLNYKPEKLYAYEVGEKAQLLDNRLTLNTSAYYYDYRNFQSFLFNVVATQVLNRNSRAYGGEMELTARPMRGLTANVAVAYNDFIVKEVFPGIVYQRPNNAPQLQLNWGLSKDFTFSDELHLSVSYYGRKISSTYYNLINTPVSHAPGYNVHDFSARLDVDKRWYVSAFLTNAFNKQYETGVFDLGVLGYNIRLYGERRTFSAAAGFNF